MRKLPRTLVQMFRPMATRSSAIERALMIASVMAALILALTAVVVYRIHGNESESAYRSARSIEVLGALEWVQRALRDHDIFTRDLVLGRTRDRADTERLDKMRFEARLNLAALGPLVRDEPDQVARLSQINPLVERRLGPPGRAFDGAVPPRSDQIDGLIAAMRDEAIRRIEVDRDLQRDLRRISTWVMVGSLLLVTFLALLFWTLLKAEFASRRALEQRLVESATSDELTGVANRNEFDRKFVQEWAFRSRYGTALSLLILDVDHLKGYNEHWGAMVGDAVLREIARRISTRLRRTDFLARSGGDEFAVIVPQYRKEAVRFAEKLRERVAEAPFLLERPGEATASILVTVSIGVAEASDVGSSRELLAAADQAMYAAKDEGRNRVVAFRPDQASTTGRAPTGTGIEKTTAARVA